MPVTWNLENATHLLRRAAFGGTPKEIQAFFSRHSTVDTAVNELLSFKPSKTKPPYDKKDVSNLTPTQSWWFKTMITSKKPADAAREKLVLFWHNHLVSGYSKQQHSDAMAKQNSLFRILGKGSFKNLMREFNRDIANLYFLDGITNRATKSRKKIPKAEPNENFGREVMELFTLGVFQLAADGSYDTTLPNYTEADVHQLARALSGWTSISKKGVAEWNPDLPHFDGGRCDDNNDKVADPVVIFGVTNNNFRIDDAVKGTPDDVIELLFSRVDAEGNNTVAMYMARKFWNTYAYPFPAAGYKAMLAPIAKAFADSNFDTATLMRAMFTNDEFYSVQAKTRTVKSPVDYIVQMVKLFGLKKTDGRRIGDGPELAEAAADMGMRLFDPPNVAGWKGGMEWINSATLLSRLDFARSFAAADDKKTGIKLDAITGLPKTSAADPGMVVDTVLNFLSLNTGPIAVTPDQKGRLMAYATSGGPSLDLSEFDTNDARIKVRGLLSLAMQVPEYMMF